MRKIYAEVVLARIEDAEKLENDMIAAQGEEKGAVNGAVVLAALKLFKNIIETTPDAE